MYSIENTEKIYFRQTKTYFEEVLGSFFNGYYRAAIVMLYSVAICDLCLKLNELSNVYNDVQAKSILDNIARIQSDNSSKSKWEKDLIDGMRSGGYISLKLKADLSHLYDDRCFSAHPAMNHDYELLDINKETALAHIKNILNELLIEPPMFNKNVIDKLTTDLEERKDIFDNSFESLNNYVCATYYSRLTNSALLVLFKSLWFFCFNKKDDEKCKANADLNRKALVCLCRYNSNIFKEAKEKDFHFDIANESWCLESLCCFLAEINAFDYLNNSSKDLVKRIVKNNSDCCLISWFVDKYFGDYKDRIKKAVFFSYQLNYNYVLLMKQKFQEESSLSEYLDFCIRMFLASSDFYHTETLYNKFIAPNLNDFTVEQFFTLIKGINENYCIYNCNYFNIKSIKNALASKLGKEPNLDEYKNLKLPLEKNDS